jgi:hypothetical protein
MGVSLLDPVVSVYFGSGYDLTGYRKTVYEGHGFSRATVGEADEGFSL